MQTEKQVITLELALKLKEFGVKQDSFFGWVYFNDDESNPQESWQLMEQRTHKNGFPGHKWVSAFTSSELGEMLPAYISVSPENDSTIAKQEFLYMWKDDNDFWRVVYTQWERKLPLHYGPVEKASTLAFAMGNMIIYLLENNFIDHKTNGEECYCDLEVKKVIPL